LRASWMAAMAIPLWFLELARAHWGSEAHNEWIPTGAGELLSGHRDEEVLGFVLASLLAASALFRLHLLLWGMPGSALGRRGMSRLRATWLPFCSMEPTERMFPPPLPPGLRKALRQDPALSRGREFCTNWAMWLGQGHGRSLDEIVGRLSSH
jgi:hypothetical protein